MRLAVLFEILGPYHLARLQAVSAMVELVAVQTARRSAEYAWQSELTAAPFRVVTLFEGKTSGQVLASELSVALSSCLTQLQPQVVAIPGWSGRAAFAALRWSLQNRVPVVTMSESNSWDGSNAPWKEWVKRQLVGCCSSGLVGGKPHADYLVQLGMPRERIFLGYDAVDNGYFASKVAEVRGQKAEGRQRHTSPGVPPPSPQSGEGVLPGKYFLASARFIEKKNLPRLLEAYARYRVLAGKAEKLKPETLKTETVPPSTINPQLSTLPWPLVLLGDGPLRSALNSQLSTLNLHDHVQMPGFKQYPELPAYYGLAGAFIHASTTEQWGLVVNEAMASGLPVLVSNRCGCAADLVQDGVNGFTFDPGNVEELAQLMLKMSAMDSSSPPRTGRGTQGEVSKESNSSLSAFGDASKRIISNWGPERFASGLKAAVDKALQVGPAPASWLQRLLLQVLLKR